MGQFTCNPIATDANAKTKKRHLRKPAATGFLTVTILFSVMPCIACSSDDDAPARAPASVKTSCPATLADTNGKACQVEGSLCTPAFSCGAISQLARCTCKTGKFACVDEVAAIAVGAAPQCRSTRPPASKACPENVRVANGASCSEAWRQCIYSGTPCVGASASDRPAADVCYCRPNEGGFAYFCETSQCSPPLPPPPPRDAGSTDAAASDANSPPPDAGAG